MLKRLAAATLSVLAANASAHADEASACDKFKWSLAREQAWFATSPKPVESGPSIALAPASYELALVLDSAARFPIAPERAPKPNTYDGLVNLVDVPDGVYQITLSDEAWIDVAQNGALVKSQDFSGRKDCPGIRKSVRFDLKAGPAIVEISDAPRSNIRLAIAPAQ